MRWKQIKSDMNKEKILSYESPVLKTREVILEQVIAGSEEVNFGGSGNIQEEVWEEGNVNTDDITFM